MKARCAVWRSTAAALAPDGKTLALGHRGAKGEKKVYLVSLDDGRILWLSSGSSVNGPTPALAFSPDGDRLAGVNADQGAILWEGLKGVWKRKPEKVKTRGELFTRTFSIRSLAFSPDGTRIALGSDWSATQKTTGHVVDVPLGAKRFPNILNLPGGASLGAVAWTPDGKQVVTVAGNKHPGSKAPRQIRFYDAADGTMQRQIELTPRDGSGLHFMNAQKLLLTWFDGVGTTDPKAGPTGHGQSVFSLTDPADERKGPFLPGTLMFDGSRSALSADGKWPRYPAAPWERKSSSGSAPPARCTSWAARRRPPRGRLEQRWE